MSHGGRVVVIGLDGFEISYVETLMAESPEARAEGRPAGWPEAARIVG